MTKIETVFEALMTGKSYNRFQAERLLHDHCLHSTISTIEKKYRITVSRKYETVPCHGGSTKVCRYWIEHEERDRFNTLKAKKEAPTSDQTEKELT